MSNKEDESWVWRDPAGGCGCCGGWMLFIEKTTEKGKLEPGVCGGGSLSGNTDTSCFGCGVTQSPGWALELGKEDEEEGGSERGV